jgi:hypothetical protein
MQPSAGHVADGFAPLIAPFRRETLESSTANVCGLWPDLRIAYVNPAWVAFGLANGARATGASAALDTNILSVVPGALRAHYEGMFARAQQTNAPVEHDYECSSPTVRRAFRMAIHPCVSGALVVVHSLTRETPHLERASPPLDELYRDARGLIIQCSNCRRVRRNLEPIAPDSWDWVPEYVARRPARTSHGLCELCHDFYYPHDERA